MKKRIKAGFIMPISLLAAACSLPAATIYTATLTGAQEVPGVVTTATGTGALTLTGDSLSVVEVFSGLSTNDIAAHIHCCRPVGVSGPVALPFGSFPLGVTAGTFSAVFDLTNASVYDAAFLAASGGTAALAEAVLVNGLNSGQAYLNIHTTSHTGGEIRGQLAAVPEPGSFVLAAGALLFGLAGLRRKRA